MWKASNRRSTYQQSFPYAQMCDLRVLRFIYKTTDFILNDSVVSHGNLLTLRLTVLILI